MEKLEYNSAHKCYQHESGQTRPLFSPAQAIRQHLCPALQNNGGQLPFAICVPSFVVTSSVNEYEMVIADIAEIEELKYLLYAPPAA